RGIAPSTRLEQKPGAPFGLVDPKFDQARGSDVAMLLANVMGLTKTGSECLVVLPQLGKHVEWIDVVGVVVFDSLQPLDVANRVEGAPADFAYSLSDRVGHRKELLGFLIEKQMIVAEVRATHVPMKVLGLQIQREHVGENRVHRSLYVFGRLDVEIARCSQG